MSTSLPALRPRCRSHLSFMELRAPGTREQAFCGTWYSCPAPGCSNSALLPSPGLIVQLREQGASPQLVAAMSA